jgi:hypothetical protein
MKVSEGYSFIFTDIPYLENKTTALIMPYSGSYSNTIIFLETEFILISSFMEHSVPVENNFMWSPWLDYTIHIPKANE